MTFVLFAFNYNALKYIYQSNLDIVKNLTKCDCEWIYSIQFLINFQGDIFMYNFLSLLTGLLIAIMIAFNGKLSYGIGNYSSVVLIHLIGFIAILIILFYKNIKISFKNNLPIYLYIAGAISVATVIINNSSYTVLGVSIPVALGLLGQLITSLAFDHYGFLGMPKLNFNKKKFIGLLIIIIGISIMAFN